MDEVTASLFGSALAATLALISLWRQGAAQRQNSRLTLLDKRLSLIREVSSALTFTLAKVSAHCALSQSHTKKSSGVEVSRLVMGSTYSLTDAVFGSKYLFGPEVVELLVRADLHCRRTAVWVARQSASFAEGRMGELGPDGMPAEFEQMSAEVLTLIRKIHEAVEPYVGQERMEGLSWAQKTERRPDSSVPWWDDRSGYP